MSAAESSAGSTRREWTYLDRSDWLYSPDEPDHAQWIDPYTGLRCMVNRCDGGHLCGYVGVTEGHPLWGFEYDHQVDEPDGWADSKSLDPSRASSIDAFLYIAGDDGKVSIGFLLDVHGGLTFSRETGGSEHRERVQLNRPEIFDDYLANPHEWMCWVDDEGRASPTWFFGFDCHHLGDCDLRRDQLWREGVYRDFDYVERQVTSLAAQIKRLAEMMTEGGAS